MPALIRDTQTQAAAIAEARLLAPIAGRAIREAAGLTLEDVGREIGVTGQAVSLWELGRNHPSGPRAVAYVSLLAELTRLFAPDLEGAK